MTLTSEDLQAIASLIDTKLQPINDRLDKVDNRLDSLENSLKVVKLRQDKMSKKLTDLQLDIKIAEREIRRDIHDLNDEMETVIEVMKMNDLIS